jgi:hypothetical protein
MMPSEADRSEDISPESSRETRPKKEKSLLFREYILIFYVAVRIFGMSKKKSSKESRGRHTKISIFSPLLGIAPSWFSWRPTFNTAFCAKSQVSNVAHIFLIKMSLIVRHADHSRDILVSHCFCAWTQLLHALSFQFEPSIYEGQR